MSPQILTDNKGNETGVFIPMEDWLIIQEVLDGYGYQQKNITFNLTNQHRSILESSSLEPLEDCLDGKEYIADLKLKNGS